jgi:tetratricopeptide (TPR) repeat protein
MARALRDERLTPADELRSLLTQSEKLLANLRGASFNARDLLRNMDRIAALIPELEAAGADLRGEQGRWEALQGAVRSNASRIVRQMRALGGLESVRRETHADGQAAWWWHLDREVAARTRRRLLRFGIIGLSIAAVLVVAGLLVKTFFPVDPRVQEAMSKLLEGQSEVQFDGDYAAALPLFEEAAALTPEDSEVWLWLGATQQKLGDEPAASESFRRASDLSGDQVEFLVTRAPVYLAMGMLDEALVDADAVLRIDSENPQAYVILAGVADARGDYSAAVDALQHAADFADKRNQPQISATARYQLGLLLQRIPVVPKFPPTPAPP